MAKFTSNKSGPAPFWLETNITVISQDKTKNESVISYKHYMKSGNSNYYPWYNDYNSRNINYLKINGKTVYSNQGKFQMSGTSKLLSSGTMTIPHNSNGSKSIKIEARYHRPKSLGTTLGGTDMNINTSYNLPTIQRGVEDVTAYLGTTLADRKKFNYKVINADRIEILFQNTEGSSWNAYRTLTADDKQTDLYFSQTHLNDMYDKNKTSTSIRVRFKLNAYKGTQKLQEFTWLKEYPVGKPPGVASTPFTVEGKGSELLNGEAVGGIHNIRLSIIGSPQDGATIKTYLVKAFGKTTSHTTRYPVISVPNVTTGNYNIQVAVVDSRGMMSKYITAGSVKVYNYKPPTINNLEAYRTDRNGIEEPSGEYGKVEGVIRYSNESGANKVEWTVKREGTNIRQGSGAYVSATSSGLSIQRSYAFTIEVRDSFSDMQTITVTIAKGGAVLVLGENSVGVNTVPSIEGLEVVGQIKGDSYIIPDGRSLGRKDPNDYDTQATTQEFVRASTIGLSGVGTYCTLVTIVPWTDKTGGVIHQIAYTHEGEVFHRVSDSSWYSWRDWEVFGKDIPIDASGKDIDTITKPGVYYSTGTGFRNPPSGNGQWAKLEVTTRTGTDTSNPTYQEYSGLDGEKYYRMHNNGNWYSWRNSTAPEAEARYVFLADVNWNNGDATVKFKKEFRTVPAVIVTGYGSDTTLAVRGRRTDGFDIRSSSGKGVGFSYIAMEQK